MIQSLLSAYGLDEKAAKIEAFGSGLINRTWKIGTPGGEYILQKVNHQVFREPQAIAHNTALIGDYLKRRAPAYLFVAPLRSVKGEEMLHQGEGYFRLFPFVAGSHSKDVAETPAQAFEAAAQFGRFTRLLSGFDAGRLKTTIPHFHDLSLRYDQFLAAAEKGVRERILKAKEAIATLINGAHIVAAYNGIKASPDFRLRVTHHDTKISNVLFDKNDKGLCVIDLDTVMPGYFISDVGDMMRTYLSPVSEEEGDVNSVTVREEFYRAIVNGYGGEMKDVLSENEKRSFFYAGQFMIYMQALRFLTDYLNGDAYYGASYPEQNLVRATNQMALLQRLTEKEAALAHKHSFV